MDRFYEQRENQERIRQKGQDLIRAVTLWSHLANVGDAKSLIIRPKRLSNVFVSQSYNMYDYLSMGVA